MKMTIQLFCIVLAFLSVTVSPQARAACQEGCLTSQNTVLGDDALLNLNSGVANTAVGFDALFFNTDGHYNTGIGAFALQFNTTGIENTAIGYGALPANTTGRYNTASGRSALGINTTGSNNTAVGYTALLNNTTGNRNIALGEKAGGELRGGDDNIDIGNRGHARDSGTIRIGTNGPHRRTFIAGISGVTVPTGVAVIVDANGHLGTTTSSARFKDAIKPMDKASEAILALKPVTFRYKKEIDADRTPQFGLVAEEVEKVNPALVARDEQGKAYTVRYEAVNAMLLNEFLKEHRKVKKLEATVAQQRKDFEAAIAQLKAQVQKVSAHLEFSKPATQTALNQ
jgi:trimeric autotransporter adhesin